MDARQTGVIGGAARTAAPYAGGLLAALVVTGLLPCCGFIVFPAGSAAIGYFVTPKLGLYPTPETRTNLAVSVGVGAGLMAGAALVLSSLIGGLIGIALGGLINAIAGTDQVSTLFGAGFGAVQAVIYGLFSLVTGPLFGILFAGLGSYLYFDRNPGTQVYDRPF